MEIGEGVTRVKLGDRVAGNLFPKWIDGPFHWDNSTQLGGSVNGMLTEYAVLSEEAVVHIPDHLSFEEAATLPCAGVTAWNALTGGQPLKAGIPCLLLDQAGFLSLPYSLPSSLELVSFQLPLVKKRRNG